MKVSTVAQGVCSSRLRDVHVHPDDARRFRLPGRVVCIVHSVPPDTDDPDLRRSQAIAQALTLQHYSVIVVSLPGLAWTDALAAGLDVQGFPTHPHIDGLRHLHLPDPDGMAPASQAAFDCRVESLKTALRILKPSAVLIASEASSALPAAIAVRELGLPYYYDIRACSDDDAHSTERGIAHWAVHSFTASPALQQRWQRFPAHDGAEAHVGEPPTLLLAPPATSGATPDVPAYAALLDRLRDARIADARAGGGEVPERLAAAARRQLKHLRVAAVMDDFTYSSYAPECELLQLTPEHALAELESLQPDLLFIESAWRGKDELWGNKVATLGKELRTALAWCRERRIPTVFWNKEDPVHFDTFITTANEFDVVFTTDMDCIARYKAALRHERVYLLPFAAQPQTHNPIEIYQRKDAFCFAGAYYARYPERIKDLENYIAALPAYRPIDIFDRNFGKNDVNYQFPPPYQPFIVGTLAFKDIDKAYKGYRYSINLNSIKQSQTMFARRVYELLASNTITVSNFSRGIRLMFGDLVITSDSGKEVVDRLQRLAGDEELSGKLRLAALRKVMLEHTYAHRLAYVASKALHMPIAAGLPKMVVLGYARDEAEQQALLAHFARQTHTRRSMVLVHEGAAVALPASAAAAAPVRFITAAAAASEDLRALVRQDEWLATMLARDYYGPNYLLDLALASTYTTVTLIGKLAHYAARGNEIALVDADAAYRPAAALPVRASAMLGGALPAQPLLAWLAALSQQPAHEWSAGPSLALDPYNYCLNGNAVDNPALRRRVDDLALDRGMGIDALLRVAERIKPLARPETKARGLDATRLAGQFGELRHPLISGELLPKQWRIQSQLPDGKHEYLYAANDLSLAELNMQRDMHSYVALSPGLNVMLLVNFLDDKKQRLHSAILTANTNHTTPIPQNTAHVRLGLRVYGSGTADLGGVQWRHRRVESAVLLGQARCLVVTNQYPSYDALYRNGFVHSRLRAYRRRGVRADVFCLKQDAAPAYREFEDIDVISGGVQVLEQLLANGNYSSILVHFLDAAMWQVLQKFAVTHDIVVWVHGADIQPWHRRAFLYPGDAERTLAMKTSDARSTFWRQLLLSPPDRLRLVFVSRSFANEAMHDLGLQLSEKLYRIIHNPIDTMLFAWHAKPAAQRFRILSIRPYSSLVYANDLTVRVILALSQEKLFHQLEFRLVGDGPLFEDTLAPLRGFDNVVIERRFLPHAQIAELHRDYGIFLCPSRSDTQGVSRDEAMSSGLVPVTNAVAAIPEFVDDSCGMLAPAEDVAAMATAIVRLASDPALFLRLSSNAAQRVRRQSACDLMTTQELELFAPAGSGDASMKVVP